MNMTHAKAEYRHPPAERARLLPWEARLRRMKVTTGMATVPGPRGEPGRRARRHRLNPGRRSVAENRLARGIDKIAAAAALMAACNAAGQYEPY